MSGPIPDHGDDDPEAILRQARDSFISAFPGKCSSILLLAQSAGDDGGEGTEAFAALRRTAHQITGLAGTVGFPRVSVASADLESLIALLPGSGPQPAAISMAIEALQQAFEADLAGAAPGWAAPAPTPMTGTIVLVEDDAAQREVVGACLRSAGVRVIDVDNGRDAFGVVSSADPDLVLLDVDLPGTDGYAVCRQIKATPRLIHTPVMFLTTRASVDDRLTGLALGADDYLTKPVEARELLLRARRLLTRRSQAPADPPVHPDDPAIVSYEAFADAGAALLRRESASVVLVRLPRAAAGEARKRFAEEARRRDLVATYGPNHLVLLFPGVASAAACARVREVIDPLRAAGHGDLAAGVASTTAAASAATIEELLGEADDALSDARAAGDAVATRGIAPPIRRPASITPAAPPAVSEAPASAADRTVVLADDDPDIARITDSQLRAAGYATYVVFDGAEALAAIQSVQPAIAVLDLMMPKMTGFDVLLKLREADSRPTRIIVLSGRGREEDVTRAFDLGADDYVTKPFSPAELMARIARLLR